MLPLHWRLGFRLLCQFIQATLSKGIISFVSHGRVLKLVTTLEGEVKARNDYTA